ncbi:hypothetical protein PsorP6_013974 [Peronosclerospora sorghi]|uniref:Uncharacterized protein n=1 Tax=Peronosclerospora sorghi TaxID=230839 RepID=A0ACC0VJI6_9STRA|nr:hypothetical protein PsorP6_013974 [Peronosclerospora sorghi]
MSTMCEPKQDVKAMSYRQRASNVVAHPLHFIDLCKKPGTACRPCPSRNRTFKYCHIDKGHTIL